MTEAPRQSLTLGMQQRPMLLPYLALLPTPAAQLDDVVATAISENPMLVRAPGGPCLTCGRHCPSGVRCAGCGQTRVDESLVQQPDWRLALETEARLELPTGLHPLLASVVGSLGDDGLFPREGPDPASLARVLEALRTVGPPGIAARSAADCIEVQLRASAASGALPSRVAALTLAELADAVNGDGDPALIALLPDILAVVTPHVVLPAADRVPPPSDVRYFVSPAGSIAVEVMDAAWFGLTLDETMWGDADKAAREWLAPYRHDARQLLDAIGARAGLLRRLAVWLADAQSGFLMHGRAAHVSLTRADAARALGHHPASIGRVVTGKVARCPDGRLVPLSAFFGGRTAILERLGALIGDNPNATDNQLAGLLAADGHVVARRTVAKYRAELGLTRGP